jgi:hypothetical protein
MTVCIHYAVLSFVLVWGNFIIPPINTKMPYIPLDIDENASHLLVPPTRYCKRSLTLVTHWHPHVSLGAKNNPTWIARSAVFYSARLPCCLTHIMTFQLMPSFFHVTGAPPWFYPQTGSRTNMLPKMLTQQPVGGHQRMILKNAQTSIQH